MILHWLTAFGGMVFLDFLWARYTMALADRRVLAGGFYAMGTIALGGAVTISYVTDPMLLIPACVGAFVGTSLSIYFNQEKKSGSASGV